MPIPVPTDSATVAAPAAAPVAAPAATTEATKPARVVAKFGPARGDGALETPVVNGVKAADVYVALKNALASVGITDLHAHVEAYAALPKSMFPGNKSGRTAFALGNILSNIEKATTEKVKGPKKPRVKQADKINALMSALRQKMGDAAFDAAVGADFLKGLGIG